VDDVESDRLIDLDRSDRDPRLRADLDHGVDLAARSLTSRLEKAGADEARSDPDRDPDTSLDRLSSSARSMSSLPPLQGQRTSARQDGRAPTYETFYGLREKPFSRHLSGSRFLYHSASHDRAAGELQLSIGRRDALAVLTGGVGTGKTTLCRALCDRLDRRTFTAFVADPFVTLEDLLKAILFDFGVISRADIESDHLSRVTRVELTAALHAFLMSLVPIGGFAVAFIDDAQTLSSDMLTQVQDIADAEPTRLGIVLIGQPDLLFKLAPRKPASDAVQAPVRARLDPLAEDEIAGYVCHRLAVGGSGPSRVEFNRSALSLVHETSRGVPQRVNLICDRALARGFEDSASVIDASLVAAAARDLDWPAAEPLWRKTLNRILSAVALGSLVLMAAAYLLARGARF
jgi:general secretion pathway protein A